MSIVSKTRPAFKPAFPAPPAPLVRPADPPSGPGEPIPARLGPAELESIVRFGFIGDAAVEPHRLANPVRTPAEAEDVADDTAAQLVRETPGQSPHPFRIGAWKALYADLYAHYLQAQALLARQALLEVPDDECPELPDSAYYEPEPDEHGSLAGFDDSCDRDAFSPADEAVFASRYNSR